MMRQCHLVFERNVEMRQRHKSEGLGALNTTLHSPEASELPIGNEAQCWLFVRLVQSVNIVWAWSSCSAVGVVVRENLKAALALRNAGTGERARSVETHTADAFFPNIWKALGPCNYSF